MTVESRMTERHESIIFTSRSFCALRACSNVARRAGCSRVGADPATGMGPSAVSSRRPFQKFRRRHTDSPASSYELASSAQSSFRFFRMEWPRLIPEPPRVAWFVERADGGIRCCCRACSYENWDREEAIPGNGISLEERRTVLLWTGVFIIIHLFRYTEKKKKRKICSRSV